MIEFTSRFKKHDLLQRPRYSAEAGLCDQFTVDRQDAQLECIEDANEILHLATRDASDATAHPVKRGQGAVKGDEDAVSGQPLATYGLSWTSYDMDVGCQEAGSRSGCVLCSGRCPLLASVEANAKTNSTEHKHS